MIFNRTLSADHASNFAAGPLDEFTILFKNPLIKSQVPANRSCIQGPWKPTHPVCTVIDKLVPDTFYIVEVMTFNAGVGEVRVIF